MIIWTKISSVDLHNFLRLLNLVMDALNARWVWQIFLLQLKECCACVAHSFSFVSFADDFLSENDRILNQCKEDKDDAGQQPDLHGCDRVRHRDSSSAIKTWKTTWVHFQSFYSTELISIILALWKSVATKTWTCMRANFHEGLYLEVTWWLHSLVDN